MKIYFKTKMQKSLLLLFMLLLNYSSNAAPPPAPITITGDIDVCVGDRETYSISPTGGLTYRWSCNIYGFIYSTTATTGTVQWPLPGAGQVYVFGIDLSTGDTLETGTLGVTVHSLPETYLTASALMGCQKVGTSDSTAQPQPPGMLTSRSGCINTCENSTVTYYAHDVTGSTFTWLVSGAVSYVDMGDSCIVTWGAPGPGTVSVTTTNVHGCRSTLNICIKVIEGPKAIFTTLPDSTYNAYGTSETVNICAGGKVQFIDISTSLLTSPIVACLWDFGDGTFRTTGGPTSFSHKYIAMGTYTARLVVRNSCGCTDTAKVTVEVGPCEDIGIDCPSVLCENSSGTYNLNPGVPCMPYAWTVKGGTITSPPLSPTLTVKWDNVDASGFGYIIFDGAGCPPPYTGKTVVKVPIILSVGTITGPAVICTNSQGLYSMPEWPTTDFNWTIVSSTGAYLSYPDQRNQAVINTLGTTGVIILKVNYKNTLTGCGGVAYDTIKVVAPEKIIGPVKFCLNDNGNWNLSGGAVGDWRLVYPDGTDMSLASSTVFAAPLNQVGNYTLSVSGLACVPDPVRFSIEDRPAMPAYIAGIDSPCADVPYNFVAAGLGEGFTFGWWVSSGSVNPATGDSTKITFTGAGPYTIKTWRISGIAPYCTSDTLYTIVDNPHPAPVITGPIAVCGSSTSSYVVDYKKGETYEYFIIPATAGSVSAGGTGTTPTITWNNPPGGSVIATLRVRVRKCATFYTSDISVTVTGTPVLTLTPSADTVCSGASVLFTVTGTPSLSTWSAVEYDFGDGTTATTGSLTASHIYINAGATKSNFSPRVRVTDINGCIGSFARASTEIWIRPLSVAIATPTGPINACAPTWSHPLTASISSGPATTTFFEWFKVGSGTSLASGPTANTYTVSKPGDSYGSYYCVVTNIDGCTDTTNIVDIDSNCGGGGCSGRTVAFTSSVFSCGRLEVDATVSGGAIVYSEWVTEPDAYDVVITGTGTSLTSEAKASFLKAGKYKFTFRVFFLTSPTDTCVQEFETYEIVPYVGGMLYSVVCNAGAYDVTVFDNSNFYPTTPPTVYDYTIEQGGTTYSGSGGPSFTKTGLIPGTVYLSHTIGRPGYPDCVVYDTIDLPVLPVVTITNTGFNPACAGDGLVILEATSTPAATFHWDFGDVSESDLNPVSKIYDAAATYSGTLTATNEFGCSTTWPFSINVQGHNLSGKVFHLPSSPCEGENVTLTYTPDFLTTIPISYDWYKETSFLSNSVVNTKVINNAGGYWVFVSDIYGCEYAADVHPVDYVEVPEGKITGKQDQCINVEYTLDGGVPVDVLGGLHHEWIRDGVVISSFGNTITDMFTSPGVHTYYLITVVPNPGGGFCRDTSDAFVVTIHGAAAPPTASFTVLDCTDYTIELTASSPYAGTFNWSHGATGTPVLAYSGGPYRVYLTDIYGCPSYSDVYVPKSPQEYLWIFPTGCYKLCIEGAPYKLLGPSGTFSHYDWIKNGLADVSGGGSVPDYSVITPGTYNLALANFYCADTSEDMDVTFVPCPPICGNNIIFDVLSTTHIPAPLCRDYIDIMLIDLGPPPARPYTISAKHGIVIGSGGTLPVAGPPTTFRYVVDRGYGGLTDTLTLTVTMPDGSICILTRYVTFTTAPCDNSLAKVTKEDAEETITTSATAKLLLSPNPAQDIVRVDYTFTGNSEQRFVEVYDMTGKLMSRTSVQQAVGSITLKLDQLSSGLYQVILRQDNEVFLRSKLAVTH